MPNDQTQTLTLNISCNIGSNGVLTIGFEGFSWSGDPSLAFSGAALNNQATGNCTSNPFFLTAPGTGTCTLSF